MLLFLWLKIITYLLTLKQSIITILKNIDAKGQRYLQILGTKRVITNITPSSVCCTYIICLTRAMFTNIDTKRNLKKIYHCHKLLRDCSKTTSF